MKFGLHDGPRFVYLDTFSHKLHYECSMIRHVCKPAFFSTAVGLSAGGGEPHIRCSQGLNFLSTGIYTFSFCWNYDCLPPDMIDRQFSISVERVPIPGGELRSKYFI